MPKLPMGENGLPLPGRELDKWILEHIMGWRLMGGSYQQLAFIEETQRQERWRIPDGGEYLGYRPRPSTSNTFFDVMEAMASHEADYEWTIKVGGLDEGVSLRDRYGQCWDTEGCGDDLKSKIAHAVCCCAWLAMGGEG